MVLNVYKKPNMTSRDVVNIISKHFNTKKVGHTGTLDPMASGVLIVCIDNDTKLVDIITSKNKEYIAKVKVGIKTDTGDITGNIIEEKDYNFNEEKLVKVINLFMGKSIQTVPIYSAVKINGKKLYEYARNNEIVELPKREIEVSQISLIDYDKDTFSFKVTVSKGTYIRSLIEDICEKLNTVGTMSDLIRTKQGDFNIENSNELDNILNNNYQELTHQEIFKNYEKKELTEEEYFKVKNGQKMIINFNNQEVIYTYQNKYIALYTKDVDVARIKLMFRK